MVPFTGGVHDRDRDVQGVSQNLLTDNRGPKQAPLCDHDVGLDVFLVEKDIHPDLQRCKGRIQLGQEEVSQVHLGIRRPNEERPAGVDLGDVFT